MWLTSSVPTEPTLAGLVQIVKLRSRSMPTVLRENGFRVMIHTADHPPPHVHCIKAGCAVLIEIETLRIRDNFGMPISEIRNAQKIVADNQAILLLEWQKVFPQ